VARIEQFNLVVACPTFVAPFNNPKKLLLTQINLLSLFGLQLKMNIEQHIVGQFRY